MVRQKPSNPTERSSRRQMSSCCPNAIPLDWPEVQDKCEHVTPLVFVSCRLVETIPFNIATIRAVSIRDHLIHPTSNQLFKYTAYLKPHACARHTTKKSKVSYANNAIRDSQSHSAGPHVVDCRPINTITTTLGSPDMLESEFPYHCTIYLERALYRRLRTSISSFTARHNMQTIIIRNTIIQCCSVMQEDDKLSLI